MQQPHAKLAEPCGVDAPLAGAFMDDDHGAPRVLSSMCLQSTTTRLRSFSRCMTTGSGGCAMSVLSWGAAHERQPRLCFRPRASRTSPDISPPPSRHHNPASLLPAPLTSRPEPFHLALASPWMSNTAQAPHRRTYRNIPIPPIDGMPLPGKREPDKWAGSLLIRRIHWRGTPKLCSSQLDGTQSRGEHHPRPRGYGSQCLPVASLTLRGRT